MADGTVCGMLPHADCVALVPLEMETVRGLRQEHGSGPALPALIAVRRLSSAMCGHILRRGPERSGDIVNPLILRRVVARERNSFPDHLANRVKNGTFTLRKTDNYR